VVVTFTELTSVVDDETGERARSVAEVAALAVLAVEREACVERAHEASVLV
jgi:hypothetical protein